MHALARLVEQVRAREGWSDAEMVRRANRAGHDVSTSRWSQMMKGMTFFGTSHVEMLVDALGEPPDVIVPALLATIGYPMPKPPPRFTVESAIRLDEHLSTADRANLLSLYRSMVRQQKLRALREVDVRAEGEDSEPEGDIEPRSPAYVRRGTGGNRESDSEDNDVPSVARPDGSVADVEDSLCEAPGGDGEADSQ
jgi:hypothetical protein